ncbi:MAG: magnesium transporter [Chloroflexota bacterium]|nr:magnesium transporter [Chloroflexota bacterium]
MDVRWLTPSAVEGREWSDVPALLERDDGFVWVDVESCDEETATALADRFGFHALAVRDVLERSHLPKIHAYPDHLFVVLHAPQSGEAGHVHLVELDQFIGRRYLVTIHGPVAAGVPVEVVLRDTRHVLERLESGRAHPTTPFELSYAIVSSLVHRQTVELGRLAKSVAALEQNVRDETGDPVRVLEEMFLVRHELLSIRTIAAESGEVYERMSALTRMIPAESPPLIQDLINRFARVRSMSDDEKEFAQGVIDFYQARTSTRMNMAMERLALIAAVLLPVSAIASIYGMNLIVGERTDVTQLVVVLAIMAIVVGAMLVWAKRMKWW